MKLIANPSRSLVGSVHLPGDKSISHRAAIFASLANGVSTIENFLFAGVTDVMLSALETMGVNIIQRQNALEIHGCGIGGYLQPTTVLNCGNSATTMRMLAGATTAAGTSVVLDGTPGLRSRPMGRIVQPLQQMGVPIVASPKGTAPLRLAQRPSEQQLKAIDYRLPVASAQVKSCLLLAGLSADEKVTLREPGPSRDHTERMLRGMGAEITCFQEHGEYVTIISPPKQLNPIDIVIPGDFSAAAFLIVAATIIPQSEVVIRDAGINATRTGLLDALRDMGADISVTPTGCQCGEPVGDITVHSSELKPTRISGDLVVRMIDEFPIFAIAAAYASGRTIIEDAEELRYKESDRIAAMCSELRAIGVDAFETPKGFEINGGKKPEGGIVHPHGDHRLAMALAVAGLGTERPVYVPEAEFIQESFPNFISTFTDLGADFMKVDDD